MGLSVIGAGFGRTGTLSLKLALEQLGFAPCHHMLEVFANPDQAPHWHAAARGEPVDWQSVLRGYKASVDWPSAHFWRDLMTAFPSAKVVLSLRDPGRWYDSMSETILKAMSQEMPANADTTARHVGEMARYIVAEKTFGGNLNKDHVIDVFNRHNEQVKREVPADRLLVFTAADGWEPLCRFLGVPVPASEYPRTNSKEEFWSHNRRPVE